MSVLPHASWVFAPGSSSDVACPPAAISGYCCPDLFVIDRSCGCLCDSGFVRRFVGSDAVAGNGISLLLAGGMGGMGCASVRSGQSISLRRWDVKILADFLSQFIGDFGVAWHR